MKARTGKWALAFGFVGFALAGMAGARAQDGAPNKNAAMLIQTLSEEKTEVNTLTAQSAAFQKMGGNENRRIARLLNRMAGEHKAASPAVVALIKKHGGDPNAAKILKPPVLGSKAQMLHATHMDHVKAVETSQARYGQTDYAAIKRAMSKRADLARKHMRQMKPYHDRAMKQNVTASATCPHCNVKMVNGKCPECGMTVQQMKQDGHDHNHT